MRRLPAVVRVCLLLAITIGCRAAGPPAMSAAEFQALMERKRQAQELFQQALAQVLKISVQGVTEGSK